MVKCSGKSHLGDNGLNYYQVVVVGYLYPLSYLLTVVFLLFLSLSLFFSPLMRTPSFFFFEIEARTDFRKRITFIVEFSTLFNVYNLGLCKEIIHNRRCSIVTAVAVRPF